MNRMSFGLKKQSTDPENPQVSTSSSDSSCQSFSSENNSSQDKLTTDQHELPSASKVTIENCGLLTINKHAFSVEYDHLLKTPRSIKCNKIRNVRKIYGAKGKASNNEIKSSHHDRASDTISICTLNSRYEVISSVARQLGWRCSREQETSNVLWTDSIMGVETCRFMKRFQKINHFPGMFEICRKDLLARNMNRMLKLFPNDYQIFPKTWHLPADYGDAVKFSRQHRNRTFILKPDQGAQGRGISLIKSLKDINPSDHMICQLYLHRPLLIDGFKFDLRVYALVTSIDPLRVYVYNEGLARFATSPYKEPKGHNTTNMYMHLTNYSVNKHSRTYSKDDEVGSKRKFSTLNRILSTEGYDVVALWNNIDDVVIKTVISAWPVLRHNYVASFPNHDITNACFEILGVDILIDQNLKPWLLEVNHSPSFHTDGVVDKEVKYALIRDTFSMLNIRASDKRRVMEEDKRRVNNRLLRKVKESRVHALNSHTSTKIADNHQAGDLGNETSVNEQTATTKAKQPWLMQVAWEETHMGGYRRVLPVHGDPQKYAVFQDRFTQASVYNETVASRKREEAAQQQRALIADREKFPVPVKIYNKPSMSEGETIEKQRKRHRIRKPKLIGDGYHMEPVSDVEERERVSLMAQRDFLVKSCGVLQYILLGFYRNKLLNESELKKYEAQNPSIIDTNYEVLRQERKLRLKSLEGPIYHM